MFNWALIKEPINWLTVWTMLLIAGLLYHAISRVPATGLSVTNS
jgi:hypothetical protein